MAETTRTTPGATAGTATSTTASQADDTAARVIADAKNMGSDMLAAVRDNAGSLLDDQRRRAADQLAAVGEALRRSAQVLDEQTNPAIGGYVEDAARYIDDFATTVRTRSWRELAGDAEDFARRWPTAFMASAIGLGFIAGRFLMSSSAPAEKSAAQPAAMPPGNALNEPRAGARHDFGAVSGPIPGGTNAGYGGGSPARENG